MNKKLLYLYISFFLLIHHTISLATWFDNSWSISEELFNYIRLVLPQGKTILELGSGWSTGQLCKYYTVYSVEHDKEWLNKYESNYIYASIVGDWYDIKSLEKELPEEYDLILVDGPIAKFWPRDGFYTNLYLFNTDVIIIFDDVDREDEYNLMLNVSKKIKRKYKVFRDSFGKEFGVIEAKKSISKELPSKELFDKKTLKRRVQ